VTVFCGRACLVDSDSAEGVVSVSDAATFARAVLAAESSFDRQQCLYLRPEPQWQSSFLPGRAIV
jgi:hypothetical protein